MRPLIIKVDDHKVESNNKAVGSIDLNLIISSNTENSTTEEETQPDGGDIKNCDGLVSSSLVRNLINKYENPKNPNLLKAKSKSMIDLQKPKVPIAPTTQDDHLYNRSQYDKEEKFDFKKVLTMFQTIDKSVPVNNSTPKQTKIFNFTKKGDTKLDNIDVGMIKQRATILLHNKPNLESFNDGSYWQQQVLELLEQICGVQPSNETLASKFLNYKKFKYQENKRQLSDETFTYSNHGEDSGIDETEVKQTKEVEREPIRSSSVKDIKKYFEPDLTEKYVPYNEYRKQESEEYEEELDYSSDSTGSFNTVQTASPTNRMYDDKEIHEFDLENMKSLVDDLINEVRNYEEVINELTRDDTEEFAEMNDSLYNILLKLENIRAYGDEELLNKRKAAIQFVQTCTSKLKTKLKN